MAACENNTSVLEWLKIPAYQLSDWIENLNAQQKQKISALKKSMKK